MKKMNDPDPTLSQIADARKHAEQILMGPTTTDNENLAKVFLYFDRRGQALAKEAEQKAAQYERQKAINISLGEERNALRDTLQRVDELLELAEKVMGGPALQVPRRTIAKALGKWES